MKKEKLISVVVPAFNEEGNIPTLVQEIQSVLKEYPYEIIIVNDGSTDKTEAIVEQLHQKDNCIHLISFSRNFGHQAALLAGLANAHGNAVISIDADMEQPPKMIQEMISELFMETALLRIH